MDENASINTLEDDVALYVDPKKRWPLIMAIFIGMLGPLMSGYGLATAMVTIGTEMNNFTALAWLFTGASLLQMIMQPLVPSISAKITLPKLVLIGLAIEAVTLLGFVLAPNMAGLIAFRTINGIGGAFVWAGGIALAGQIVTPEKRASVMGVQMFVNSGGAVVGPLLAGVFSDMGNWRIWGIICVAVSVISMIMFIALYPKGAKSAEGTKVDGLGTFWLAVIFVDLAVLLQLSGTYWPWASVYTGILVLVLAVSIIAFIKHESKIEKEDGLPAFRLSLFKSNPFKVATIGALLICIATNGISVYVPTYAQQVLGLSATNAGLGFTIGSISAAIVSLTCGFVFGKKRLFRSITTIGCAVVAAMAIIMTLLGEGVSPLLYILLITFGYSAWTGWISSVNYIIGQMLLPTEMVLDATAGITSMQMVGAFLGIAVNSAIINTFGFQTFFIFCAAIMLLSIVVYMFLKVPKADAV